MRQYLNIGEVAKLLHMSTSQIRYYEKEGLIKPKEVSEGKYRLYDFPQLEILEIIILLREMDMPLKSIKALLDDDTSYNYKNLLSDSISKLDQDIEELKKKRRHLKDKLETFNQFQSEVFEIVDHPQRTIHILDKDHEKESSPKMVYDFTRAHKLDYLNYDAIIYVIGRNEGKIMGIYEPNSTTDYTLEKTILEKGSYFSYTSKIKDYDATNSLFEVLHNEATKRGLRLIGPTVHIENLNTILYSKGTMYITVQMKIAPRK